MADRSGDWLGQARCDLSHAVNCCKDEHFEWSCFSAQQAAEKAIKAVYLHLHGEGWGHSVYGLLKGLGDKMDVSQQLLDTAKGLDKHYIPTRYPNGFDSGMPADYYTKAEAEEAIKNAERIIEFCENCIR